MTETRATGPLRADDAAALGGLAEALARAGYTAATVTDLLGAGRPFTREAGEVPYYRRLLPEGTAVKTLVELFLLGVAVDEREAAAALEPVAVERLEALGLVRRAGGAVEGLVDLVPFGDLVLASDPYPGEGLPERLDHVYGVTPPARALASLVARREVEDALDLCTGSGIQALVAARHAGRVVATDLNARALAYAQFSAALNGIANVELRQGDMLEPVEGETYDLIVCNPPFVISPDEESGYLFRDSGTRGDRFCEELVRRLPVLLREGGLAHVLVSWTHARDEHWSLPLRGWVEDSGCDALLVHYNSYTPLQHATEWNRALRHDPDAYGAALDRWLDYYARQGIEAVAWGGIVLRRRSGGDNWIWDESPRAERMDLSGHHVLRALANCDLLAALADDRELLDRAFLLADDHRLDRAFHFEDGAGVIDRAVLRLEGGFEFELAVDLETVRVLSLLDGRRTLREALLESGIPPSEVEGATGGVRRMLELGFLVAD